MRIPGLAFLMGAALLAQAPPPPPTGPALLPGEGLAVAGPDRVVRSFGEATRVTPMGSLAKLVWLKLEADDWSAREVGFKCTGTWNGFTCWNRQGHGRVDLAKALEVSCNLAFLAWAQASVITNSKLMGEGAERIRVEEAFEPFIGKRMPPGEGVPPLTPAWVGDGDLLQTSPDAILRWFLDPAQDEMVSRWRRLAMGFLGAMTKETGWWMKTGTAPVPGEPGETIAWVAGSNGESWAILRLPRGKGPSEGLVRFHEILGLPYKKKK